ncbi:MAG: hypothetical protein A2747_03680 [Candidatus Yonathbacteria bacterium RIFCSPHIGHO2_01_FULL_44_41]|uniref:Uncharacterized protein n=1 Tax=Candidatus Yonathbacteria bacterium RIFCSPHIGHO2_02_FULL_44_14 TaxID=1802724 RepID=A0A1G2S7D3_9BACT|nr:MAG: hypothetical protein A2747_03680 [Candidatus Yonathbacteria bacterium RIFCSPHIGHO2_01_FULL_44_41]OHA81024.1 MAG: hypothetical protein A3D51_01570 [Candidatus Yonathbacteria bacterium RIFCSPHIGHO2_02_FULL_44_14]OHA81247.1 MAG: hypothetical protein A3B06_03280 [Candidatus Yonathbacteria bacterium RIFCSPLOWO2_01_FULL_43_20]
MDASMILFPQTKAEILKRLCSNFNVVSERQIMGYTEEASRLLKFLVKGGYLERKLVEEAVHNHLLDLGCAMQIMHLRTRTFPDHLGSVALFGYALKHGKVRPAEVTFDHGEIAGEYILAADGFLKHVVEQLFSYKRFEIPLFPRDHEADHFCC